MHLNLDHGLFCNKPCLDLVHFIFQQQLTPYVQFNVWASPDRAVLVVLVFQLAVNQASSSVMMGAVCLSLPGVTTCQTVLTIPTNLTVVTFLAHVFYFAFEKKKS